MTSKVILPEMDWWVCNYFAFRTAVVQYGVGDGTDTARLSETANMVIALMPQADLTEQQHADWYEQWAGNVAGGLTQVKAMGLRAPWPEVSKQLVDGSFGLAFVYPPRLDGLSLVEVLAEAQRLSSTVAVASDEMPYRVANIRAAADREGWGYERSRGLWVLRYRPDLADTGGVAV